jgi:hypothetical protein
VQLPKRCEGVPCAKSEGCSRTHFDKRKEKPRQKTETALGAPERRTSMCCIFCRSKERLTDEHVFPAFMGGDLEVRDGSCKRCNREFGRAEAAIKDATTPLLNLLQIENRYNIVPSAQLNANIRGLDLKDLPAFMDGDGNINLRDVVRESTGPDGRRLRQGFFLTKEAGDRFVERARARGLEVKERGVPTEIVIEANYTIRVEFIASLQARRLAAKIALAAIAFECGTEFALRPQFDELRTARTTESIQDLPVRFFANAGLMSAYMHTPYQHSVMCYLSGGMHKGWALVTLFGGICYLVSVAKGYPENQSRQFSIFYDAAAKRRYTPIVLADEMTLIGHVLSPATIFEDPSAVHDQWSPILNEFCAQKGVIVEPIGAK